MSSLDLTSFDSALKVHYTNDRVREMVYKDNPLLALLSKMEDFGGKNLPIPILYGNPQGRSSDFATAKANKKASKISDFVLVRSRDHAVASIDNETMQASKGNANAFMEAATTEIDGALNQITRSLAIALYRSGSGSIGQMNNSSFATDQLELKEPEDVTNFEVGQIIVLSTTDGGGTVETGSLEIVGIDRDLGILTVDQNIDAGIPTAAQNDYIFIEGDYDSKIKGLKAWLPDSAPSNTPFFSVDRTKDSTRLAGVRFDGSALPIEEAITGAIHRVAREGGRPNYCFLNYKRWNELVVSLGSKVQYIDDVVKSGEAYVSFKGVMVHGPKGPVKVMPDQNCPNDRAFLLQMDTWKLYSLGACPTLFDSDGVKMLREANDDAVEVRIHYYAQLGCQAPGYNATVKLA